MVKKGLLRVDHLVLASRCSATGAEGRWASTARPQRALLFDAGCADWGKHVANSRTDLASAQGPSLPLLVQLYARQCIHFDGIWAWEAKKYEAKRWWRHVPLAQRARLHFYNVPVYPGTASDPLLTIAEVASEEDFVVFKLDIDTFSVEHELVDEVLTNRRGTNASRLIDEFFFEYHFDTPNEPWLNPFWHQDESAAGLTGGTVDHALSVMTRLRKSGVRAHFWP